MTDTQIPAGPWVIRPDAQLPFDLRISSAAGAHIAKVYGEDAGPREQLATALAAVPQMIEALQGIKEATVKRQLPITNQVADLAVEALCAAGVMPCPGHVARDDDSTRCRYCGASSFDEAPQPEDGP